ncbi:MAG TPA: S-methyl-5-thioribose-1-phosphate isomerase [Longimicrobiales bacterium]
MRHPEAVRWTEDGAAVDLLDQTRLPEAEVRLRLESADAVAEAIRALRVRGAPAIGIAAAMGLAVESARHVALPADAFRARLEETVERLRATRPTAVNLSWALERMRVRIDRSIGRPPEEIVWGLYEEANAILVEDRGMCRRIGEIGLEVLPEGEVSVLTHCNAGALATGGMGTALAPVYVAHALGRAVRVYVGETRPLLQGSRLTAWELERAGIPVTVVADTVVATLMRERRVDVVLTGADRIAANGDVANKIGTYGLAVLARHHGIPFYVAAPLSTLDPETPTGREIPIEERDGDEVRRGFGRLTAPASVPVYAPAFDVTPAELVTGIVTDRGVLRAPYEVAIRRALGLVAARIGER